MEFGAGHAWIAVGYETIVPQCGFKESTYGSLILSDCADSVINTGERPNEPSAIVY